MRERVVVLHNAVAEGADPSTADVLDETDFVIGALAKLGVAAERVAVPDGRAWEVLDGQRGTVVFNLVESAPGAPTQQAAAAGVLELLGLPFTGSAAAAIWLTTDKLATRALLVDAGLAVAAGGRVDSAAPEPPRAAPPPWIVKPAWEDSSVGLEGDPVCRTVDQLRARVRALAARFPHQPLLAEHFLPGREFNLSLVERGGRPEVLPVAEIEFRDLGDGAPALVSFAAKWEPDSPEYRQTVRVFPDEDEGLLMTRLREVATTAWYATGVAGYARVDIRLDENGAPRVLEVNANPCIAADGGFVAAAAQAGLDPARLVSHILAAARRHGTAPSAA